MIRIGAPASTIDTPLEHLSACHRRIEDRLATLARAADHWRDSPVEALDAIRKSLQFLDSNGALHTLDEEESLFPRLRPRLTAEEEAHLDRLEQQHHEVESVLTELKSVVAELAASPLPATPLEPRYRELVTRLKDLYRPHMRFEDEVLMRLAGHLLNQGDLMDIAREMKARRTEMDELMRRVLHVFVEMDRESLDLHILFEAGGNEPTSRSRVLDAVNRLMDAGYLESRGSDFYSLTSNGRGAAGYVRPGIRSS
jgi:iron-sulfur cluster repair protein YtfE (RIC family)